MKVTITVDNITALKAKKYAKRNGVSLSFAVENHLRSLLKMPLLKKKQKKQV